MWVQQFHAVAMPVLVLFVAPSASWGFLLWNVLCTPADSNTVGGSPARALEHKQATTLADWAKNSPRKSSSQPSSQPGQSSGENLGTLRNHDMPDDAQDDSNNESDAHGSDAHGSDAHGNGSDGDGDGDSHSPRREKIRRIVDFDVEDSDGKISWTTLSLAWELQHTGAVTPTCLPTPFHRRSGPPTTKRLKGLAEDLDAWEVEREERVQQLAEKHGMKVAEAAGWGERYTMPEVKAMVAEDPSMLEGFSREEEKEMIKDTLANRKAKARGTRANHLSAAADAKRTMDRLMVEITNLAERVGMIGFAMFTRSHAHDKTLPGTIQSWGALDFFREVMKKDPADVAHLFELWAVSRERGKTSKNKLLTMQQECTSIITTGLQAILNVTKCAMNYENYISKLVYGKGVGLVNWPDGVDFKRMSLQSAVGPLQTLLDSLKCGTTRWKVLTSAEKQKLIEQYDEMVKKGEVKVKEKTKGRKERKAKKGVIVEDEEEDEEEPRARKLPAKPKRAPKPPARDEDDEDDEESRARKPPAKPKRAPKPHARDEDEDEEDEEELRARKPPVKSKHAPKPPARDEDDDEEEGDEEEPRARKPPVVKSKRAPKPPARNEDEGDEEEPRPSKPRPRKPPAKSSRTSKRSARDEDEEDEPATAQERLWALVQKGREANDKARRKSSTAAKEGGMKRKRAEHGEGDGDAPVGKRRRTEEGSNVQGERARPKPKPLYRTGTTAAASSRNDHAPAANASSDVNRSSPSPAASTDAPYATSKPSGSGRPNMVRGKGKGKGPPGVRFPAVVKPKAPRKLKAPSQKLQKGVHKAPVERFPGVNPAFAHLLLVDRRKYVPPSFGIRHFAKIVEVVIPLRRKPHVILTNPVPDVNWEDEDGTVPLSLRFPETNASLEQSADEDEEEMPDVANNPNTGDESDGIPIPPIVRAINPHAITTLHELVVLYGNQPVPVLLLKVLGSTIEAMVQRPNEQPTAIGFSDLWTTYRTLERRQKNDK
ncbi:hypothetical protein B0H14DRAFT_2613214 [Mycena olivaceomarginata]|nr:hypothetical protein B0H14DRAFT_2613214 [Mycena olivaceomarginata]